MFSSQVKCFLATSLPWRGHSMVHSKWTSTCSVRKHQSKRSSAHSTNLVLVCSSRLLRHKYRPQHRNMSLSPTTEMLPLSSHNSRHGCELRLLPGMDVPAAKGGALLLFLIEASTGVCIPPCFLLVLFSRPRNSEDHL